LVRISIPRGTIIFEGAVAPQITEMGGIILGGGNQVYIPRVFAEWILMLP
jgi:hypothetical protein